jgi:hypothetical protein
MLLILPLPHSPLLPECFPWQEIEIARAQAWRLQQGPIFLMNQLMTAYCGLSLREVLTYRVAVETEIRFPDIR